MICVRGTYPFRPLRTNPKKPAVTLHLALQAFQHGQLISNEWNGDVSSAELWDAHAHDAHAHAANAAGVLHVRHGACRANPTHCAAGLTVFASESPGGAHRLQGF